MKKKITNGELDATVTFSVAKIEGALLLQYWYINDNATYVYGVNDLSLIKEILKNKITELPSFPFVYVGRGWSNNIYIIKGFKFCSKKNGQSDTLYYEKVKEGMDVTPLLNLPWVSFSQLINYTKEIIVIA